MAERRMFCKTIIDSDAFLDMPLSAQALYFHLCMRADDEGFINNYKKIQRMVGASDDDLKLLYLKKFILTFESGVIVVKHWRMHNYIQKDRFKPTVFHEEKALLRIKENNAYTFSDNENLGTKRIQVVSNSDTECIQDGYKVDTECIQDGYSMDTLKNECYSKNDPQTRMNTDGYKVDTECIQDVSTLDTQVRLGKVSIELGKDSIGKVRLGKGDQNQPDQPEQRKKIFNLVQQKWNELEKLGFKPIRIIGPDTERGTNLYNCLVTFGTDSFYEVIDKIKKSQYLQGNNKDNWQPDFDWVVEPDNYRKILEDNYKEIFKPIKRARNFCPEAEHPPEYYEQLEEQMAENL